jgi:hypothetical protein
MNTLAEWLKWVEARSEREEDGCLVWQQACNGRQPAACIGDRENKQTVNIRRKLWEMRSGRPPRRAYIVVCTCDTERCVEPTHLKEAHRSTMQKGRPLKADHRLAITLAARRRGNLKLTQADVDDIRYGEGEPEEKAVRYGITVDYVKSIMAHRVWKALASPFAGLFA